MKTSTRNWIIAIVIIIIIIGVIYYFTSRTTNPLIGVNNYDLRKLSAQDLSTYNSLPDDAARMDFLRILEAQGKITPIVQPVGSTPPLMQTTQTTGVPLLDSFINWLKNRKFKKNFVQTAPIDENGCDVYGFNAIGEKCFGY